ncbi:MAG: oligosaccharide flippase family protein [Erysipelotrichaceae bacterium]|nr:oligosaccharide flippase family protein [Erysipelotrichaceae bacterium]
MSYVAEAIKILSSLIYTPIMLRLLGQSEYGLYQLVYSVVSYLSLLSLGFGSSYVRFYSKYTIDNDDDGVARLNGMFLIIFTLMSIICILCGAVMLGNITAIFGNGLTNSEYATARILMFFMIFNLAITFPNSLFNCVVTAHEEFFFQKILIVLQNLLNPFLTLPLLIMGFGSIGMVSVTTFLTIAVFLSNMFYCFKKLNIRFIFNDFQFSLLKEMWIFTFFIFLNQIIDQVNWSVDKFLLGRFSGTVAVAIYGVGSQINTMYIQLSSTISNVFVPKVNMIVAKSDDNGELSKLFTKVGRIQFILLALVLTGFIFFGKSFISFWAGEGYEESFYVALLLIGPVTIPLIQNLGIEIQRAKNMHKARSIVYFLIAIANVFISIPLIQLFGASGAAMGTAIALIAGNVLFMNWYYYKKIGLDMIDFWRNIGEFVPALVLPCILGIVMNLFVSMNSLIVLGLCIIFYSLVYCLSMWFFGMNNYEKSMIEEPINKFLYKVGIK